MSNESTSHHNVSKKQRKIDISAGPPIGTPDWRLIRLIKVPRSLVTDDREGMIDAVLAGGGLMRIGMFDPALIASGRLRKVLGEWQCLGGQPIYALYRKGTPLPPKIAAFLAFVGECFTGFDRHEVTLTHNPTLGESVHPMRP